MNGNQLHIETSIRLLSRILSDLKTGALQIPPFQRDFVWQREDIRDLFDSIKNSYPIGSIILWTPKDPKDWTCKTEIGAFSIPHNLEKCTFVLDGYQRLSSLLGCLTNPNNSGLEVNQKTWETFYSLYYDLEDETFTYLRTGAVPQPCQIPVYILMSSSDFRQYSRKFIEPVLSQEKINLYLDRADKLSNKLLEYQIAVIEITNANIEESVDIFSRINSRGTDISFDWMVNALSYDKEQNFRFADIIDDIESQLKQYNFDKIGRNTIFRCIQSSFGKLYIDQGDIEKLARRDDFVEVTKSVVQYIVQAVAFLYNELKVIEGKLLPYNIQLIFIMEFFRQIKQPTEEQLNDLKNWFWITTYTNYFTVNSLANQRQAYMYFVNYLKGYTTDIMYMEESKKNGKIMEFPQKLNMGSVRAKAFTLFWLNHLTDGGVKVDAPLNIRKIIKTLDGFPANILIEDNKHNHVGNKDILHNLKVILSNSNPSYSEFFFINTELYELLSNNQQDLFIDQRTNMMMEAEERFVTKLGLKYTR